MLLRDVMSLRVETLPPEASVVEAAQKMDSWGIGVVPVCDGSHVLGILTDRDITVQVTAKGLDPQQVQVRDVMTAPVVFAREDQTVEEAARLMEQARVRRLVVVDDGRKLVGIVAMGDLAAKADPALTGEALHEICANSGDEDVA